MKNLVLFKEELERQILEAEIAEYDLNHPTEEEQLEERRKLEEERKLEEWFDWRKRIDPNNRIGKSVKRTITTGRGKKKSRVGKKEIKELKRKGDFKRRLRK